MNCTTGAQLNARYILPCAEQKFLAKKISRSDFLKLEQWAIHNIDSDLSIFNHFPDLMIDLKKHSEKNKKDIFSFENVSEYWRKNHKKDGDCCVRLALVFKTTSDTYLVSTSFGICINRFNLPIEKGNLVFIHHKNIIEIRENKSSAIK